MSISGTISHCPPQICGIFSNSCKLSKLNVYFPSLSFSCYLSNHHKETICLTKVSSIPCPIFSISMVLFVLKNSFTNLSFFPIFFSVTIGDSLASLLNIQVLNSDCAKCKFILTGWVVFVKLLNFSKIYLLTNESVLIIMPPIIVLK